MTDDVTPIPPLADAVRANVGLALAKHSMGEEILWDYSIGLDPQAGAFATLAIWLKGIIIGSHFNFTFQVNPVVLATPEDAEDIIVDVLTQARQAKSEQFGEMQRQMTTMNGPLNGSPPVP